MNRFITTVEYHDGEIDVEIEVCESDIPSDWLVIYLKQDVGRLHQEYLQEAIENYIREHGIIKLVKYLEDGIE